MRPQSTASARFRSELPPSAFMEALTPLVEPLDGGFKLVSKLSPGGIVVRALRAPETDRGWFGKIEGHSFSIALVVRDKSGSPFEPIMRGKVTPDGDGSLIALDLASHPNARMFSILFTGGGVLLATASLIAISQSPGMGLLGLGFAALFLAFPPLRARIGFRHASDTALTTLGKELDLTRLPDAEA